MTGWCDFHGWVRYVFNIFVNSWVCTDCHGVEKGAAYGCHQYSSPK